MTNLVLHYLEDIDAIFTKVYLTFKKDDFFLLNMNHPVFTSGVDQDWVYDAADQARKK